MYFSETDIKYVFTLSARMSFLCRF